MIFNLEGLVQSKSLGTSLESNLESIGISENRLETLALIRNILVSSFSNCFQENSLEMLGLDVCSHLFELSMQILTSLEDWIF